MVLYFIAALSHFLPFLPVGWAAVDGMEVRRSELYVTSSLRV
jgi:hypothetical protein